MRPIWAVQTRNVEVGTGTTLAPLDDTYVLFSDACDPPGTELDSRIRIIGACLFLLAGADEAAANCAGGATSRTVSPGENLALIMATSTTPCTLTVNPGTYDAPAAQGHFQILEGITVRAPNGATLRVPGDFFRRGHLAPGCRMPKRRDARRIHARREALGALTSGAILAVHQAVR